MLDPSQSRGFDPIEAAVFRIGRPQAAILAKEQSLRGRNRRASRCKFVTLIVGGVGQRPGAAHAVGNPQTTARTFLEHGLGRNFRAGRSESVFAQSANDDRLSGGNPQITARIERDPDCAVSRVANLCASGIPATIFEIDQTAIVGRPQPARTVFAKSVYHPIGHAFADTVVGQRAVLFQQARTGRVIADPHVSGIADRQCRDVVGRKPLASARIDAFEANTVETEQARTRSEPDESIP
ncbi:MAG: hypothetical protein KDI72_09790 [Xanthomonadales bacterium]|nr:hypothetical protein [Xanthomonadales bacterium]MCB1573270.1 hypothetical protein [Xanthomonadales bacterium]